MSKDNVIQEVFRRTWQERMEAGVEQPWLASVQMHFGEPFLARFERHYQQLCSLPRRTRRRLKRKLAMSLAAAALLLALAGTPAGSGLQAAAVSGDVRPAHMERGQQSFRLGQLSKDFPQQPGNYPPAAPVLEGASSAIIIVDGNNPGTDCTLEDAITAANTDTATGNCVAGTGADILDIQVDVTLTALTPAINSEMTLEGNSHAIAGDGTIGPLLNVVASGDMTLNNATVTNGYNNASFGGGIAVDGGTAEINNSTIYNNYNYYYGGGIANFNGGNLTVNDSVITDNTAAAVGGGILNHFATAEINNSAITGNQVLGYGYAGGIRNVGDADMTIVNSTVSGNMGFGAAAISNPIDSSLTYTPYLLIENSTISGNSASYLVGGIDNVAGSTLVINNSTLSGNNAAGGYGGAITNGYYFPSYLTLNDTTITGNMANGPGGGVWNSLGQVEINRSIISGNTGVGNGVEVYNYDTLTADNYNVFGHDGLTTAEALVGFTPGASDILATSNGSLPTLLTNILNTVLQNNGGSTETHALTWGSPALDGVTDGSCAAGNEDQRHLPRGAGVGMGGPLCDIGAFELQNQSPTDVNLAGFGGESNGGLLTGLVTAVLATITALAAALHFRKSSK